MGRPFSWIHSRAGTWHEADQGCGSRAKAGFGAWQQAYDGLASTDPGTDGTPENESDLGNHIKIKFR